MIKTLTTIAALTLSACVCEQVPDLDSDKHVKVTVLWSADDCGAVPGTSRFVIEDTTVGRWFNQETHCADEDETKDGVRVIEGQCEGQYLIRTEYWNLSDGILLTGLGTYTFEYGDRTCTGGRDVLIEDVSK